jgi:hypothetical protein
MVGGEDCSSTRRTNKRRRGKIRSERDRNNQNGELNSPKVIISSRVQDYERTEEHTGGVVWTVQER